MFVTDKSHKHTCDHANIIVFNIILLFSSVKHFTILCALLHNTSMLSFYVLTI